MRNAQQVAAIVSYFLLYPAYMLFCVMFFSVYLCYSVKHTYSFSRNCYMKCGADVLLDFFLILKSENWLVLCAAPFTLVHLNKILFYKSQEVTSLVNRVPMCPLISE